MRSMQLEVGATYLFATRGCLGSFVGEIEDFEVSRKNLFKPETEYLGMTVITKPWIRVGNAGYFVDVNDVRWAVRMQ